MQNNFSRVLRAGLFLIVLTGASQVPSFAGFGDHNKAEYKKGKVMKEIGEKDLASLKDNSPFPSNSSLDPDRLSKGKKNRVSSKK
ncbi:MAG: hypothetical protein P4L53_03030 [Candidatus Obscuribacterales bacterium]|nr:hypothetical protein [Candidatus Obscuribacterales bacterium]